MNCPGCGAQATYGLKYCNRCGENLAVPKQPGEPDPPPGRATGAAWALGLATVIITLGGLGIVFTSALEMARPAAWGNPTAIVMAMIVFGSTTIFGVVAMLIRLFTKIIAADQQHGGRAHMSASGFTPQSFNPQPVAQMPPPPVAMPSVTEHTTRTFDQRRFGEQDIRE
jgi:hypothetical protein